MNKLMIIFYFVFLMNNKVTKFNPLKKHIDFEKILKEGNFTKEEKR